MELSIPETWAAASAQVLPVLRRVTEPAQAWAAERRDPSNTLLRHPAAPLLRELVVIDLPDVRLYVNQGLVARWGVSPEVVFSAARDRLGEMAASGLRFRDEWGLWQLDSGDGYESSRLLLPGWLRAFEGQVAGRPIAAAPSTGVLLVSGTEEPALPSLIDLADRAFRTAGGPLSPVLYVAEGPGLAPWEPAADHPLAQVQAGALQLLATYEYAEQKEQLFGDPDLEDDVAPIALHRDTHTGRCRTIARWRRSPRATLLPRADRVLLIDGEREVEQTWEELADTTDLEPMGWEPDRYRATWPTEPRGRPTGSSGQ